jgi:hypothetical protein
MSVIFRFKTYAAKLQIIFNWVQKKFEVLFFEASRPVRDDMLVEKAKRLPSTVP